MATQAIAERVFLDEPDVTVTNCRVIVSGRTYAMSGITSIRSLVRRPSRKVPAILFALGALCFLGDKEVVFVGLILIAAGIAWWVLNKPTFVVRFSIASGEIEALSSKDAQLIHRITGAMNKAIAYRG